MIELGVGLTLLSGVCNGLFTAPMKLMPRWRWENIWLVFIVASCLVAPVLVVTLTVPDFVKVFEAAPAGSVAAALLFGFAWGFGAICFGLSVTHLGVAVANTLVIGLSSAFGSLVPLAIAGKFGVGRQQVLLYAGVAVFLLGVWVCGIAGRRRDSTSASTQTASWTGYLLAAGAGIMSAVFNIGYTLALPIAQAGEQHGYSPFYSTNIIWLLMLGAGSVPNIVYCVILMRAHRSKRLFIGDNAARSWALSLLMAVLWGGSIFLYGAATPLLGAIGPSIGWPLSLAVGLLTANIMGFLLREWQSAGRGAVQTMVIGISLLLVAIVLCAVSTKAA